MPPVPRGAEVEHAALVGLHPAVDHVVPGPGWDVLVKATEVVRHMGALRDAGSLEELVGVGEGPLELQGLPILLRLDQAELHPDGAPCGPACVIEPFDASLEGSHELLLEGLWRGACLALEGGELRLFARRQALGFVLKGGQFCFFLGGECHQ
jgi:hypothetical protein